MTVTDAQALLQRYQDGTATAKEQQLVEEWYRDLVDSGELEGDEAELDKWESVIQARIREGMGLEGRSTAPVKNLLWKRLMVAASVLIIVGASSYILWFNKRTDQPVVTAAATQTDVKAPATNRAMITLSNGQKVFLDSAANGQLAVQGNVIIQKTADGQIAYNGDTKASTEIFYNTLSNPRGSKVIDLTLSDGTKVWLNAESSLTYPTAFNGTERKVTITGEAYFEVTHDVSKPFIVSKGTTTVQVLGTHFNVNSYDDESIIKVTLLEGSVQVSNEKITKKIRPGDQAQISSSSPVGGGQVGAIELFTGVDTDEVMAWKEGKFVFGERSDINTIMRQLARWYDIDVEYKGTVTQHFWGSVSRNSNVSQVLKVLQTTGGMHYTIEGKKVTITP